MKFKRIALTTLTAVTALSLLSGCNNPLASDKDGEKESKSESVEVSSIEDLLEAIEPGAEIVLKKGTYNLTDAIEDIDDDIGIKKFNKEHDYVQILDNGIDGYEIVIKDVDGLVISGQDGKTIEIETEPRYSDVFRFEECTDIELNNMTLGHVPEMGQCAGDVLEFDECENVVLNDLDLYGCGTYAIAAIELDSIEVNTCKLRDCSYGALFFSDVYGAVFSSCEIYENEGYFLLDAWDSEISFKKCDFNSNTYEWDFISDDSSLDITFDKCSFGENESRSLAGGENDYNGTVTFKGDNSFSEYSAGNVTDVASFFDALETETEIVLSAGVYDFGAFYKDMDVDEFNSTHSVVQLETRDDGVMFTIIGVDDLYIHGENPENPGDVQFCANDYFRTVIVFDDCQNLYVADISGYCDKSNENTYFFDVYDSSITIDNVEISDIGGAAFFLCGCTDVYLSNLYIHDCGGPLAFFYPNGSAYITDCVFIDNDYSPFYSKEYSYDTDYAVDFVNCEFGFYETYVKTNIPQATFTNCTFNNDIDLQITTGVFIKYDELEQCEFFADELVGEWYFDCAYVPGGEDDPITVEDIEDMEGNNYTPVYFYIYDDGTAVIKNFPSSDELNDLEFTWDVYSDGWSAYFEQIDGDITMTLTMYLDDDNYMAIQLFMEEDDSVNDLYMWFY